MLLRKEIKNLECCIGKTVKLMGFVKRIRKVGSKLMFIVLSDYSGTVQLVVSNNLPKSLTQESSIEVLGQVVEGKYDLEIHVEPVKYLVFSKQ